MVLNNLRKSVDFYRQKLDSITDPSIQQLQLLQGLPFYSDWHTIDQPNLSTTSTKTPDFNHALGLPEKNGQAFPLFDYEQLLYNTLEEHKHIWIKKATGLGVTEFMLRYMAWLCLSSPNKLGTQMCIVTGPRIELAITLIDRMKGLFRDNFMQEKYLFDT
jgi:hypothetical protein